MLAQQRQALRMFSGTGPEGGPRVVCTAYLGVSSGCQRYIWRCAVTDQQRLCETSLTVGSLCFVNVVEAGRGARLKHTDLGP